MHREKLLTYWLSKNIESQTVLSSKPKKKLLLIYDDRAMFTNTTRDHVGSFTEYSEFDITLQSFRADAPEYLLCRLSEFDGVIVHYSARFAMGPFRFSPIFKRLTDYEGKIFVFLQDEYDHTDRANDAFRRLKPDVVFTCVPDESVSDVYISKELPDTRFVNNLTGYISDDLLVDRELKPIKDREILLGYRGRTLPFWYGDLAREKSEIANVTKKLCREKGIRCDIECDSNARIYGDDWINFVASSRATLGTESGANVFDFDGKIRLAIAKRLRQEPSLSYEEIHSEFMDGMEGKHAFMNQLSPRLFEAISLRTGLVLFEGTYSGAVQPDVHFIPLKKDFSNFDEVIERVQDHESLQEMVDRAYHDVVENGNYHYRDFIKMFDENVRQEFDDNAAIEASKSELANISKSDLLLTKAQRVKGKIVGACYEFSEHSSLNGLSQTIRLTVQELKKRISK